MFCPRCGCSEYIPGYYCTRCGYYQNPQQNGSSRKRKKKRSVGRFFAKLFAFFAVNAVLALLVYTVGNYVSLKSHSGEVVQSINAGSFYIDGADSRDFDKLPTYVQNRLQRPRQSNPIVDIMLPYVNVECVKVNGLWGEKSVEYKISAPNTEIWLTGSDAGSARDQSEFFTKLERYSQNAPRTARNVTVVYYSDGLFRWQGNYNTPEFIDAMTGGMNSAYAKLYEEVLNELEGILE